MKEYKINKGWAIFIYITAPLLTLVFVFLLILPLIPGMEGDYPFSYYLSFGFFSAGMLIVSIVSILDTLKGKFVIDENKIFIVSTFSNRELLFHEIKGYRIREKFIFIEPFNSYKKKIKINSYFAKTNEIKSWLSEHYSDLDLIQATSERKEILNNPEFGWSKKERKEKLNQASKIANVINWIGGLLCAWTFIFPAPYNYAIIASIAFPVICLIILKYFNGLIRIDARKDTAYPSIFFAIFMTALALFLRVLLDFNVYDYTNVWIPSLLILCCYVAILIIGNTEYRYSKAQDFFSALGFILFMFAYSCGTVVSLNCIYDKSEPKVFKATVLNKRISTGKTKMYYLELTPWGEQYDIDEVTVSKDLYNRLSTNAEVKIYFMKGKFEIPWFEITE